MSIAPRSVVLLLGQLPPSASSDGVLAGGADTSIVAVQEADGRYGYYVVSTGRGISISYSRDLKEWRRIGRVFAEDVPRWAQDDVPKANGIWAPDLSFHKGLYYLYYSVSSFGSQRSVIGLAVNKTLDPTSPDYRWEDRGKVIESWPGKCDFNAIDPALFVDRDGTWCLLFGSFRSGIVHHTYDVQNLRAQRVLQIRPLSWTADGWPASGRKTAACVCPRQSMLPISDRCCSRSSPASRSNRDWKAAGPTRSWI